MRRIVLFACLLLMAMATGSAQIVWDKEHLAQVKNQLAEPAYAVAYEQLLSEAGRCLEMTPPSVMMKDRVAASGDKHDYLSLSRYFWPDPTKPDGLPYVSRDGVSNPELNRLDRNRLSEMTGAVTTLSLAWFFSGDERYAEKAVAMLRTWFLDKDTHMNPNLNYAQMVPGQNGGRGRCYGLIDSYSFVEMLDAVRLLESAKAFTAKDQKALRAWFKQFLQWVLTSDQGREESRQANNHSVAYDLEVMAFASYVGDVKTLEARLGQFFADRLPGQIADDGSQPHELWRTLSFGYSEYNLAHLTDIFQIAKNTGMAIAPDRLALLEKAADYLTPYLGKPVSAWPHQQISQWDEKQNELSKDVYRLSLLDPARADLAATARAHLVKRWADRFFLLYYRPDQTDNAFARADVQLRYQLEQTRQARRDQKDKQKLMPRCVERDGRLRLVGIHDWCSGFFPGILWQMYQYSHDQFWREQAVSNTWLIEDIKYDRGTHDLGFMVFDSFGKAWQLTGEQSYRDVVLQAASSLGTRFDERVGCIRSWSWGTPDRWQFAVIIDNMMNLEMLFEASLLTGDKRYYNMAVSHADKTMQNHFRPDYSSYHVVDYNPEDGSVIKRITFQGLFDESVWSRGQGWGLYGFTMCYRYTHNPAYLDQARHIARFWLSQPDMPADHIPYWDMCDPAIKTGQGPALDGGCPRDASAAAVVASALYELSTYVDAVEAKEYRQAADDILASLTAHYQPEPRTAQGFLLLHSTGNYPSHDEIDVPINYADYYYLEALLRRAALSE